MYKGSKDDAIDVVVNSLGLVSCITRISFIWSLVNSVITRSKMSH